MPRLGELMEPVRRKVSAGPSASLMPNRMPRVGSLSGGSGARVGVGKLNTSPLGVMPGDTIFPKRLTFQYKGPALVVMFGWAWRPKGLIGHKDFDNGRGLVNRVGAWGFHAFNVSPSQDYMGYDLDLSVGTRLTVLAPGPYTTRGGESCTLENNPPVWYWFVDNSKVPDTTMLSLTNPAYMVPIARLLQPDATVQEDDDVVTVSSPAAAPVGSRIQSPNILYGR